MNNFNFMDNRLLILVIILGVFYFLFVFNKKIVENFGAIPLNNLIAITSKIVTDNNTKLVLPFNTVDMSGSNINMGSELKIGTITLTVNSNNELVVDKPIKIDSATIGKWEIRNNRMGIKTETDMLNKDNSLQFVDYDTNIVNSKICINNIETSQISPAELTNSLLISAPRLTTPYDMTKKKYNILKLNGNELLSRGINANNSSLVGTDNWANTAGNSKGSKLDRPVTGYL